jgi:DNA topoisomerase-1
MHTTMTLRTLARFENITQAKKNVVMAIEAASKKLGNTPSICRKCYVHPLIIESYMAGAMFDMLEANVEDEYDETALNYVEGYIIKLLQSKLKCAESALTS